MPPSASPANKPHKLFLTWIAPIGAYGNIGMGYSFEIWKFTDNLAFSPMLSVQTGLANSNDGPVIGTVDNIFLNETYFGGDLTLSFTMKHRVDLWGVFDYFLGPTIGAYRNTTKVSKSSHAVDSEDYTGLSIASKLEVGLSLGLFFRPVGTDILLLGVNITRLLGPQGNIDYKRIDTNKTRQLSQDAVARTEVELIIGIKF